MLNPCATPRPADWIVNSDVEWYELAVFGPTKFDDRYRNVELMSPVRRPQCGGEQMAVAAGCGPERHFPV